MSRNRKEKRNTACGSAIYPVLFVNVCIKDRFWAPRIRANRDVTIPMAYKHCKTTGRIDAWKWRPGTSGEPHIFWDSDVAKWMEAVAYSLALRPDAKTERKVDKVISMMAGAQERDGYLNSHFSLVEPGKRWTNLRDWHELYCAGHLIEAAVAYFDATGKRKFLDIMCRYADHIHRLFGRGRGQMRGYPGHQEIELALVKLYRSTGRKHYLDMATYFVDERGRKPNYFDKEAKARGDNSHYLPSYSQVHKPVREQKEAVGHAVRALYMYSGMADVAAETGDKTLLSACRRLWKNLTQKRMYITGGVGSSAANEGFTADYDLPNESAYAETCAAIALVFWAHRMLHLDPDGRYADVMERALYNGVISGVSLDGERFFYANPLAAHPAMMTFAHPHVQLERQEWFGCSCCPVNVARLLASFGSYIYSRRDSEVWVHLYVAGRAELEVGDGNVILEQKTHYPWDEKVQIEIKSRNAGVFTLALRIPAWCRRPVLKVNGRIVRLGGCVKKGYAKIKREWANGEKVELVLPMPIERVTADPRVRQNTGRVALQRGPIVYCLEEVDNGKGLNDIVLPGNAKLSVKTDHKLFGGIHVITGKALRSDESGSGGQLYRTTPSGKRRVNFKAIPYFLWANRGKGEMLVWVRGGVTEVRGQKSEVS